MAKFLFELGTEEIPTSQVTGLLQGLQEGFQKFLSEAHIDFGKMETYSTNRRFVIFITRIAEGARDQENLIKGPPRSVAFDEEGNPGIALKKFAESRGIDVGDVKTIQTPKGPYICYKELIPGRKTIDLLSGLIPRVLESLSFPKTMRWNSSRVGFVRPIKNILAIVDDTLVPCSFAGVKSSQNVRGHLLLSEKPVTVNSFKEYMEALQKHFVILETSERREKILNEISEVENDLGVKCNISDDLFTYHLYNNEYPVVFQGSFDPEYLDLPSEIISTFLTSEKKLFPTLKPDGSMSHYFIGVSNVPDESKFVSMGNSKIIRATFEDARFFWEADRRLDFLSLREELKKVTFHRDAGDYHEKTTRVAKIALFIEANLPDPGKDIRPALEKAALHCKNDLCTQMVREFPSLQGIMGALYYKEAFGPGEAGVYQAIYDHYLPRGFSECPEFTPAGMILALADKIDNLVALISRGLEVTGSRDPYGLRRDANGVIKIISEYRLDLDLPAVISYALNQMGAGEEKKAVILDFFSQRIENVFKDIVKFRYDIVDAVLSLSPFRISANYQKARQLTEISEEDCMQILVEMHKRLKNILKNPEEGSFQRELIQDDAERVLYEITVESGKSVKGMIRREKYIDACSKLIEMKPVVDRFFDEVLVMAKDAGLRRNRLILLRDLDRLISGIADFSRISE